MLLTITTTAEPATDLGYLLFKHPAKVQMFPVSNGNAHVFYPEARAQRCTAAMLLELDPIGLARAKKTGGGFPLGQYVNDRPYAASSLFAVALKTVFGTAMTGKCPSRQGLADSALPLEIHLPTVSCGGDTELVRSLFEPLGWEVRATPIPLDPEIPEWGDSAYADVRLSGTVRLADALNHLYVLLPALDGSQHYWVDQAEVEKLLRAGSAWLATHPQHELIAARYLAHRGTLVHSAVEQLSGHSEDAPPDEIDVACAKISLAAQRKSTVLLALHAAGARSVADLGCGQGALTTALADDFQRVLATDVSPRALETAARRLRDKENVELFQSSLLYRDVRLRGFDAAVLMEVIEHIDPPRLETLARNIFGDAKPKTVLVTTPNREYNTRFPGLTAGTMRHGDHRFEWTRAEFAEWAERICVKWNYHVRFQPIGDNDPEVGAPSQLAIFDQGAAELCVQSAQREVGA